MRPPHLTHQDVVGRSGRGLNWAIRCEFMNEVSDTPADPNPPDSLTEPVDDHFVAHSLWSSMFFPQSRLFVAGNPKAAGTSLRWWLLEVHGVDVAALTAGSLWAESAPSQVVWDDTVDLRYLWDCLSEEERQDALTSTDVLTVVPVRHPVTRLFSAWSGKHLSGEPYYEDRLPESFPRLPDAIDSSEAVAEHFAAFVSALADHVAEHPDWTGVDVHFAPQHLMLARPPVGPTLLLRQEDTAAGLLEIEEHLRAHGLAPAPARRINETIVGYRPDFVDEPTLDRIVRLYDADFAAWDYERTAPASSSPEANFDHLNDVRGRNRRYGVIHRALRAVEARVVGLERELAEVRQREQELLSSHSWRVTRPLRWASARLKGGSS
jgi:hypothetical protein